MWSLPVAEVVVLPKRLDDWSLTSKQQRLVNQACAV